MPYVTRALIRQTRFVAGNGIGDIGAMVIAMAVRDTKTLKKVHLFGEQKRQHMFDLLFVDNLIGNVGTAALAQALTENTTVEEMWLSSEFWQPDGSSHLQHIYCRKSYW